MPYVSMLDGVLCRVLMLSSLAFSSLNQISVELSTPRFVAPDGVYFCFDNPAFAFNSSSVSVLSLKQGGTIWQQNETELVANPAEWARASFFQSATQWNIAPVETGRAADVLGTDAYYSRGYARQRYDNLLTDGSGVSIDPATFVRSSSPAPSSSQQVSSVASAADGLSAARDKQRAPGNCILVTGAWKAATRYQLTLAITNPSPPASSAPPMEPPALWMLPLSYNTAQDSQTAVQELLFAVRGHKQGRVCSLRSAARAALPRLFNACEEAWSLGLVPSRSLPVQTCLAALQGAAPAHPGAFPFTAPPMANLTVSSFAPATCASSRPRAARYGECISCGNGVLQAGECVCNSGYITNLVGTAACGSSISTVSAVPTNARTLAAELCTDFAKHLQSMMAGQLADRLVHSTYLAAFVARAAYLLDWELVYRHNATFWASYAVDVRASASPTRAHGVAPNCRGCRDGQFKDIYSHSMVAARDDRYQAIQTFRLIGYILANVGYPCPALWDPQQPLDMQYGPYEKAMCLTTL